MVVRVVILVYLTTNIRVIVYDVRGDPLLSIMSMSWKKKINERRVIVMPVFFVVIFGKTPSKQTKLSP